jgi:hypothetical protein
MSSRSLDSMNVSNVSREPECDDSARGNVARSTKAPNLGHVEQHETQLSSVVARYFDRFEQPHDDTLEADDLMALAGGCDMTI